MVKWFWTTGSTPSFATAMYTGDGDCSGAEPAVEFTVSAEDFERLQKMLDEPPEPNDALKELMRREPIWED